MDRYHQTDVMSPAPGNGSWVLWTDHCASLADAQAEIARLRGALKRCREAFDSCTPGDYSTGHVIHPYFDEDAVNAAQDLLDGLGI